MLSTNRVKFGKLMMTTLRLSIDSFSMAYRRRLSVASPQQLLTCSKDPWTRFGVALIFSVKR